jgi:hypothetical protein
MSNFTGPRSAGFALAAMLLAGCAGLATPAQAQPLDAARAFATALYTAYGTGDPDYLGADASKTFAPHLLALIRRDRANTPAGEVGILDGDPICDCQDAGGLRMTNLVVKAAGPQRAQARAVLHFPGETRAVTLDLESVRGHWRVADVHTRATPSLAGLLEDGLQASAPGKTAPGRRGPQN